MILSNQIQCLTCGDRPYSAHRHDFKRCKCGSVAVDGGQEYCRRVGTHWKELSLTVPDEIGWAMRDAAYKAEKDGKNPWGILLMALIAARDRGWRLDESLS